MHAAQAAAACWGLRLRLALLDEAGTLSEVEAELDEPPVAAYGVEVATVGALPLVPVMARVCAVACGVSQAWVLPPPPILPPAMQGAGSPPSPLPPELGHAIALYGRGGLRIWFAALPASAQSAATAALSA